MKGSIRNSKKLENFDIQLESMKENLDIHIINFTQNLAQMEDTECYVSMKPTFTC